jgi:hypothetical protein
MYNATAMAYDRRHSIDKMDDISTQLSLHLVKILLCGEKHESVNHWTNEVNAWVDKAYDWSYIKSGKRLKESDVADHLFSAMLLPQHISNKLRKQVLASSYLAKYKLSVPRDLEPLSRLLLEDLNSWKLGIVDFVANSKETGPNFHLDTSWVDSGKTQTWLSSRT